MRVWLRSGSGTSLVIALMVVFTGAAAADHLEVETVSPEVVGAGDIVEVRVVVRSAETKERVAGATVIAEREATIAGFSGRVEVARGMTDELGVETLRWQERGGSVDTVTIGYAASGETEFETTQLPVITVREGPQVVRSTSGVRIPGLGAWVLIALLVGVWAVIQLAMVGPVRIASLSSRGGGSGTEGP